MGQRRKQGDGGLYKQRVISKGYTYDYWVADWKDDQGHRHRASGATPEEALARKNRKIAVLTTHPTRSKRRTRKPSRPSVEEAASLWLAADHRLSETSRRKYASNMRLHVFPYVGDMPIHSLDVTAISRMTERQKEDGIGESAAWHSWKTLHTMLGWATKTRLIPENPMTFMEAPRRTNHRAGRIDRYIDSHTNTVMGIIAWASEESSPIHQHYPLIMAMALGLRRAEVLGLTRDAFDMGTRSLAVRARLMQRPGGGYVLRAATKNGKSRSIPLPQLFYEALLQAYNLHQDDAATLSIEDASGAIIGKGQLLLVREDGSPITYNAWNTTWRSIQQNFKDQIEGEHSPLTDEEYVLPHEMRHIAASILSEQGETLATIQDVLGHLTPAMSEHYRHVLERSRRELADRWGAHVQAATKSFGSFYNELSKAAAAKQNAEVDSGTDSAVVATTYPENAELQENDRRAAPERGLNRV